ncbi:p15-like protein [Metarhizium album ARSEF 1941]|uniref:p15-like protein n=1 Tax=Metarhizium album (strain ARSEF 1941) TaxID=1081103 RepID=A0A0B2X6X5_METAS|nr:p15-like protein [Metarhizium album ARSEF 1941]KHO01051.1 p15-like protein [Metarhizium album ARSEF 1941]
MKPDALLLLAVAATALAAPASPRRLDINGVTDRLLFVATLPQFDSRRDAEDPPCLDWSSDGCTSSPDNPFGFPFLPACHRHDFGYRNYRNQKRFTGAAKDKIDSNFKSDLYYQCKSTSATRVCNALADVYYQAVRLFGGMDATKRGQSAYDAAVAEYNAAVRDAQAQGLLPVLH